MASAINTSTQVVEDDNSEKVVLGLKFIYLVLHVLSLKCRVDHGGAPDFFLYFYSDTVMMK